MFHPEGLTTDNLHLTMPPKKKVRRAASSPADHGEDPPTPADVDSGRDDLLIDPWTDEQETLLLKSIVRWKPVGLFSRRLCCAPVEQYYRI